MSALAPTFFPKTVFRDAKSYQLLPLRFTKLDAQRYVVSSLAGEYLVVPAEVLRGLLSHQLSIEDPWVTEFEARHLLTVSGLNVAGELLAAQYRTRQSRLPDLAALHIFVVTLRCDNSCQYCQVSRVSEDRVAFDMSLQSADRAIGILLGCPAENLKVEFQGGEPLLNFPLIRHVVATISERAPKRNVEFVVATTLAPLSDEMLEFFVRYRVYVSTSIDGPRELHNRNRPRPSSDAYERTVEGIRRCREKLGPDSVSALMTSTLQSLEQPEEIVDEYVRLGFREIFLRCISPYGFALRTKTRIGYETDQFVRFYKRGLARILEHNRNGTAIRETYASIILRKMLTSWPSGYVDLQSPAGAGIGALVYNYDGDVYASDEARMLAEMGDKTFRLGNVHRDNWNSLYAETELLPLLHETMSEGLPGCCDCAFQPFCGSDPIGNHATQGDPIGHRPTSAFCRKNIAIFRHLIALLEDDPEAATTLRRWAM